jgi:hypothetical protein
MNVQHISALMSHPKIQTELIYPFPFIVDSSLQSQKEILSKFFTISCIVHIRTSNYINAVSKVINFHKNVVNQTYDHTELNVVDALQKKIWQANTEYNPLAYDQSERMKRHEQEMRQNILDELNFIKQQLQLDNRFKRLNPSATLVRVDVGDTYIDLPLIVGTLDKIIPSSHLYLYLFLAAMTDTKFSNIEKLKSVISSIDINHIYNSIIKVNNSQHKTLVSGSTDKVGLTLMSMNFDEINKTLAKLAKTFDKAKWENEVGIKFNIKDENVQFNLEIDPEFRSITEKQIINIFVNILTSYISHIINSAVIILEPYQADVNSIINTFNENIIKIFDDFTLNVQNIADPIIKSYNDDTKSVDVLTQSCDKMLQYDVYEIFRNIDRDINIHTNFNLQQVSNFSADLMSLVSQLSSVSSAAYKYIEKLLPNNAKNTQQNNPKDILRNIIDDKRDMIDTAVVKLLEDLSSNQYQHPNLMHQMQNSNTLYGIVGQLNSNNLADMVEQLREDFRDDLVDIIKYFYTYLLCLSVCESFKLYKVKLESHVKNINDWPNFILTIPMDYVNSLYQIIISEKIKKLFTSKDSSSIDEAISELNEARIRLNDQNAKKRIESIATRLDIPNIIVVDSNNDVVYKYMFAAKADKTTIESINTFNKHQSDLISL